MASVLKRIGHPGTGQEHLEEFKETGTDPTTGQTVYAQVVALEPLSIGGGGAGGGGDGAILDGVTPTIKATVTASKALKVDGSAVVQPVSGPLTDTQLRASAVPISYVSGGPIPARLHDGA